MGVEIKSTAGYLWLDSWVLSSLLQMMTRTFCQRHLTQADDPKGRQYDQMVQAARSVQANIAEGSSRHQTSRETEMKLLDVARASACELASDYLLFITDEGQAPWPQTDPRWQQIHALRLDAPRYGTNLMHDVGEHLLQQREKFAPYTDRADKLTAANALLILTARLIRLLEHQLAARLDDFRQEGGFTEALTEERLTARANQSAASGAPACPLCGKPMVKRLTRKGIHSGRPFWGCSAYPECKGTREVEE